LVKAADFRFLSGEEFLTYYQSSPEEQRLPCPVCGALIITRSDQQLDVYGFALGTLLLISVSRVATRDTENEGFDQRLSS
jgi:hypothetical protein